MSFTDQLDSNTNDLAIEERIRRNREEALRRLQLKRKTFKETILEYVNLVDPIEVSEKLEITQSYIKDTFSGKESYSGKVLVTPSSKIPNSSVQHREPSSIGSHPSSKQLLKRTIIRFQLLSRQSFEIKCDYRRDLNSYFQSIQGVRYDVGTGTWNFPLEHYGSILRTLESNMSEPGLEIHAIPKSILALMDREQTDENPSSYRGLFELSCIGSKLESSLLPFQMEGVYFALKKKVVYS